MDFKKLLKYSKYIDNIKGIILSNVIVRIVDTNTNQVLWSCSHGKSYGRLKNLKIDVEQDLNLTKILEELLTI